MTKNSAWLILMTLLPGLAGCSEAPPAPGVPPADPVGSPKLIRLIDHLGSARIESPLLSLDAGSASLDSIPGETLWRDSLGPARAEARVAVEPGSSLRVVAEPPRSCARWRVTEQAGETALRAHRASGRQLAIQTTPKSDALLLSLDPSGDPACDDPITLAVTQISIDETLELSLLKRADLADGADPTLGIAKHGQLLPVPAVAEAHPPFDHNFDFRDALYAPTPTNLSFDLTLPIGAQLRFAIAVGERSIAGDAATFSVVIATQGRAEQEIYQQTLRIDETGTSWHWHEVHLDLSEYGERRVALSLRTRSLEPRRAHALWGHPVVEAPRSADDPPNVIVIAVDTLRADRFGDSGLTPHLDSLATDGVRFDQAISSSDWTRPAFASIFTGLTPARHGVIERLAPLAPQRTTLAERFRTGGWATHAILYKPYLYDDGHHQGFDTFFNVPQTAKFAEQNLRKALIWLQANRERRFFLFVHFDDPHQPLTQPAEFVSPEDRAAMQALGLSLPAFIDDQKAEFRDPQTGDPSVCSGCAEDTERFRTLAQNLYDDEVAFVDDRIGALLDYVRETGLYDDAVIAFVSDHGESLWSHGDAYGHGNGALFDALIHVPLVIKPPRTSGMARGTVVSRQVRAFDLMPTLLDLAGLPAEPSLDARSLRPLMTPDASPEAPRVAIAESEWGIAIRREDAKYMHWGREFREAWFDLANDPAETRDLAASQPGPLSRFRLEAASHYVPNLPGRFVAVTGAPPGVEISVRIAWSAPTRLGRAGAFGLGAPVEAEPAIFGFRGETSGGLGFLAHFRPPPGAHAEVEVIAGGAPVPSPPSFAAYDPEALSQAALSGIPAVHLYRGGGIESGDRTPASLDAQRIEALRALGYLE